MKKLILILFIALPVIGFSQKENLRLGEDKKRQEKGESSYEAQKAEKLRQMEERQRRDQMKSMMEGPDQYVYMEILVVSEGKAENVVVNFPKEASQMMDETDARKLAELSSESYQSLVQALNVFGQEGWEYMDSFDTGSEKQSLTKVILRKGIDNKNKRQSRR